MSTYPGGKNASGVVQLLINQIPPHDTYIEPFLGGGAVFRYKRPARLNIGLDVDAQTLTQFFESTGDDAHRSWGDHIFKNKFGDWASIDPVLLGSGTFIVQACAFQFLRHYRFQGGEFTYWDPPYLASTRRRQRALYRHEMLEAESHVELLEIANKLPSSVKCAISGYWSSLYAERLKGWRLVEFTSWTRGNTPAREHLWCNYDEPIELHDYRYLGRNRTERQRIKRKTSTWLERLQGMPLLESRAVLHALQQWRLSL